jgi:hypothetical protein
MNSTTNFSFSKIYSYTLFLSSKKQVSYCSVQTLVDEPPGNFRNGNGLSGNVNGSNSLSLLESSGCVSFDAASRFFAFFFLAGLIQNSSDVLAETPGSRWYPGVVRWNDMARSNGGVKLRIFGGEKWEWFVLAKVEVNLQLVDAKDGQL